MPKKQNSKYSGFYWYMQDILPDLKRQGRSFPNGMADAVPAARPLWKQLSPMEKARFEKRAKDFKRQDKEQGASNVTSYGDDGRLDNVGNRIAFRTDEEEEFAKKRIADRNWMTCRWPESLEDMMEVKFYLISFQYLVQYNQDFIPLEIGVAEWSMAKGISKSLHIFIRQGEIPMGYRFKSQQHSDETHGIPIDDFGKADGDYRGLWQRLVNFVNPNGEMGEFPPLFCTSKEMKATISQLDWLYRFGRIGGPNPLSRIFVLEDMLQELTRLPGKIQPISVSSAVDILTTSMFDYEPNTRCSYHEEIDNNHCALATVKRWAYAMADLTSRVDQFNYPLTKDHLPQRTDETSLVSVCNPFPDSTNAGPGEWGKSQRGGAGFQTCQDTDTSRGPFASTDIRYRDQSRVVVNLGDDESDSALDQEDDSDDLESQYSYSSLQQKREQLNVDRYGRPNELWKEVAAAKVRPVLDDEEEFPTLGGPALGGSSKASTYRSDLDDDARSTVSSFSVSSKASGWQLSAEYVEKKREEDAARARQMSLSESMRVRAMNNELSAGYVEKNLRGGKDKQRTQAFNQRGAPGMSYTGMRGGMADRGRGAERGRGIAVPPSNALWQPTESSSPQSVASSELNSHDFPSLGGAMGARAPDGGPREVANTTEQVAGEPRKIQQPFVMTGLVRGRGRGVWSASSGASRAPAVQTGYAAQERGVLTSTQHDNLPPGGAFGRGGGRGLSTDMQNLSIKKPGGDSATGTKPGVRPPPGFGRGVLDFA